ncbi:MAG: UPF0175 family protein [Chloroflexi bacterium]|nr:UPF0175 family protein [Chloroflexota bacterium]
MRVSFSLPESQFVAETPEEGKYAALGLYQAGELSIGAACELAAMDRYSFLDFCKEEGVLLRTQTPEELQADLKKFTAK